MVDEEENEEALLLMLLHRNRLRRKERQPEKDCGRSCWVREIFTKRKQQEDYHNLVLEMRLVDREIYFR